MLQICVGCSSEDESGSDSSGSKDEIEVTSNDLIGYWRCIYQQWVEAGDEWHVSYESNEYYIQFNNDFTGSVSSGDDQLMEIMGKHNFTWAVSGSKLALNLDRSSIADEYVIKEFAGNEMTLYWSDGEYNITCKFKRDEGGTYKPVLGEKITRITNYYLRNRLEKEIDRYYDFEYDGLNRIRKYTMTVLTGNGYVSTEEYSYIGDTVKITGWDTRTILVGENGYLRVDNKAFAPQIDGQNITRLTYDKDGYLTDIEYGEEPLKEGKIHYQYEERGYSTTLKSSYEKETYQYLYNIEFKNDASIDLISLYISGGYFSSDLLLFDMVGKRIPYLPGEYEYNGNHGTYRHEEYIYRKDKKGRIVQIEEVDRISPRIWDIEYEYNSGDTDEPTDNNPDDNGKIAEAVDLGLSVKWASWNMGATAREQYGKLYVWGMPDASSGYVGKSNDVPNGVDKISGTKYDIARFQWGGSWRLPTSGEQGELITKCKWELCTVNGVHGAKVIGPNGNSIFLPAAGYENSVATVDHGKTGYYWSGITSEGYWHGYPVYYSLSTDKSARNYWSIGNWPRSDFNHFMLNSRNAMSIRPVCD